MRLGRVMLSLTAKLFYGIYLYNNAVVLVVLVWVTSHGIGRIHSCQGTQWARVWRDTTGGRGVKAPIVGAF